MRCFHCSGQRGFVRHRQTPPSTKITTAVVRLLFLHRLNRHSQPHTTVRTELSPIQTQYNIATCGLYPSESTVYFPVPHLGLLVAQPREVLLEGGVILSALDPDRSLGHRRQHLLVRPRPPPQQHRTPTHEKKKRTMYFKPNISSLTVQDMVHV